MSREIRLKLASRLRQLREKHGYTQERLAELADIDYKHIQLLESKRASSAKMDTIEKLAKAFNMSIPKFLDFK